jgi:hypothetical protein
VRVTRLFGAFCVLLCAVATVAGQATPPAALSTELRSQLQQGRFDVVTSIRGLPLGVRDALQTLFGSGGLDIAEPGAEFQRTGGRSTTGLPTRRLVSASCTNRVCLVYYERGGTTLTRRVALFTWTPARTQFEWGGAAPAGLATADDVRKAVLAGAITPETSF